MAFTRTWDASYEAIPGDTDAAKEGALRIRHLKNDISERLEVDHSFAGDADDGKHKTVRFLKQTSDPAQAADEAIAYIKEDATNEMELFFRDEAGDIIQLTKSGKMALLELKNAWAKAQYTPPEALTDGATVTPDLNLSNVYTWTIGGNRTLAAPTNKVAGQTFMIVITQDGTGGRTITYNAAYKFPAGHDKQPASDPSAISVLSCYYDGANILATMTQDFGG